MNTSFFSNTTMLAPPDVIYEETPEGGFILSSPDELEDYARCIGDWLEHWAATTPSALFLAERNGEEEWVKLSYAQTRAKVGALAQSLLDMNMAPGSVVVCLSDNSMNHALLMLAAMHIGHPFTTVSSAYSRLAKDYSKITTILHELNPGLVYAEDGNVYGPAIRASNLACPVVFSQNHTVIEGAVNFAQLQATPETRAVRDAFARITPDTHAKYLLTSGSTGHPKVVINTHRMLCANQQQILQTWRFLREEKPVVVSWLPWSHTFGTNHNFNMILSNGGSLYIDEGRPVPGLMHKSVRNLREIQPNLYFNVPKGFDALLTFLEDDEAFARDFFGRMKGVFYAAAALPQVTWDRLDRSARSVLGDAVWFSSAWGATETSPLVTNVHWLLTESGCIGLPVPGTSIKFIPNAGKFEMRVKGPQIFPGYRNNPEQTALGFDEEGYYKIGDAAKLVDPADPKKGIRFDGRVAEDFKLTTATWVSVGTLRIQAIDMLSPYAQDVVVTGHDRDEVGLLVFPSIQARSLPTDVLRTHIACGLEKIKSLGGGSSQTPTRALLMDEPPNLDAGEITDKGYINQRTVLTRRAEMVLKLYASEPTEEVIYPG